MKTFDTNFAIEKAKKTGASPVWILKIPFVAGTVYLSDRVFDYTGITIKAWVASWGKIDESIDDEMSSPQVSDFEVDLVIDPDEATDIHDLLWSESVETLDCELYLWFEGLTVATDPMVLMWSGNIVDFERINELLYNLRLVDESVRIDKHPGRILSLADYANASLDDVGYQMPIVYGAVEKVPALRLDVGKKTSLISAITAAATDFYITDGTGFANGSDILIDAEEIHITTISTNHITACTRGYNSTTAVVHSSGALVLEKQATAVFMFADHPVKAIDNIYALRADGVPVDITSLCTKYTGQTGNELGGYEGLAVITCPGYVTFAQAVAIGLTDGITVGDNIAYTADTPGESIEARFGDHAPITLSQAGDSVVAHNPTGMSAEPSDEQWIEVTFGGTVTTMPTSGTSDIKISVAKTPGTTGRTEYIIGTISSATGLVFNQGSPFITTIPVAKSFSDEVVNVQLVKSTGVTGGTWSVTAPTVKYYSRRTLTTTLNKTGAASRAGAVTLTGNQYADVAVGDKLLISGDGYQDDGAGTFTGTPDALIERPDHIFKHFLYTYVAWPVADFSTDAATPFAADSYAFSVSINTRKRMKEWLAAMALQCRCWFRFASGKAYLLYRTDTLASDKTITAAMIRMNEDYTTSVLGPSRSPLDEIINKISLYYQRDWTISGREAYQAIVTVQDATSITAYGEKEKPDLFLFDFIRDATMAADVAAFYLARYKDRKKVVTMDLFLDNAELEFADAITVAPLGALVGEVRKVNFMPGSGRDMRNDMITVTMREY